MKIIVNLLFFTSGFVLALRDLRTAERIVRIVCRIVLIAIVSEAIAGVMDFNGSPVSALIHKWLGHAIVIAIWSLGIFAIGVCAVDLLRRRIVVAFVRLTMIFFSVVILLLAAMSGYLRNPLDGSIVAEETENRFIVMHMMIMPLFASAAIYGVSRWFRSEEA